MNELNSLSECIKQIFISKNLSSEHTKINIEIVGDRIDMYQNILPLLFNLNILVSGSVNEYNNPVDISTFKSDVILLDGPGKQMTECEEYIEFNKEKKEYYLIHRKKVNITTIYDTFKSNGYYFY
jgi:hypothetical protein